MDPVQKNVLKCSIDSIFDEAVKNQQFFVSAALALRFRPLQRSRRVLSHPLPRNSMKRHPKLESWLGVGQLNCWRVGWELPNSTVERVELNCWATFCCATVGLNPNFSFLSFFSLFIIFPFLLACPFPLVILFSVLSPFPLSLGSEVWGLGLGSEVWGSEV